MSDSRHFTSEDLTLFAMQLLSPEEHAEVAAYLEQSPEARQELAEINGELAIYAHSVDLHSPPAQARERLMKQLNRERKAIPIDRAAVSDVRAPEATVRTGTVFAEAAERIKAANVSVPEKTQEPVSSELFRYSSAEDDQPKRGAMGKIVPWVGWAVAAGLAVVAWNFYHERDGLRTELAAQASQVDHLKADAEASVADAAAARKVMDTMSDSSAMRVTLTTYKAATIPTGRATYVASSGALIFLANNLAQLQPTKTYELWLLPAAEGQSPIPAGTFVPDARGNANVIMPPLPKGVEAKGFAVTMEAEGGSATPTMPIVLAGE
jgi:hypothetical protein